MALWSDSTESSHFVPSTLNGTGWTPIISLKGFTTFAAGQNVAVSFRHERCERRRGEYVHTRRPGGVPGLRTHAECDACSGTSVRCCCSARAFWPSRVRVARRLISLLVVSRQFAYRSRIRLPILDRNFAFVLRLATSTCARISRGAITSRARASSPGLAHARRDQGFNQVVDRVE